MDNQMQQETQTAETTEVEQQQSAAADLGKFKSVEALMQAYSGLEAEFTRRSQRLKELEQQLANKADSTAREVEEQPSPNADQERQAFLQKATEDPDVKNAVIGAYVKNLAQGKNVPLLVGGVSVSATKSSPKSLHDAGELTKQFLQHLKQPN